MATIIEKRKDGKLVSYKFRAYLGKQNDGRQIAKYCTWQIPEGLSPTRARKAAEKAAAEWEKEARFAYERDIKEPERAAIREIENQRTDFVSFIENIFFPICLVGLGEEDFTSLDDELIQQFSRRFKTPEMFVAFNGKIMVLPIPEQTEQKSKTNYRDSEKLKDIGRQPARQNDR